MNQITITIKTTNAAFEENVEKEISYLLRRIAHDIEEGSRKETIQDINGNKVGTIEYK
jgi:hypothetical protein